MLHLLTMVGAPAELSDWLQELESEADAWDYCDRGDWLVWIATVAGIPPRFSVGAAGRCVELAIAPFSVGLEPLLAALDVARQDSPADECVAAAEACEAASREFPESYRVTMPPGYRAAAAAAAYIARAAEGLAVASARIDATAAAEALTRAGGLGVPPELVRDRAAGEPIVLPQLVDEDPVQQWLVYAVAAAAQAVVESAAALVPAHPDQHTVEEVEGMLSDLIHERLDPIHQAIGESSLL